MKEPTLEEQQEKIIIILRRSLYNIGTLTEIVQGFENDLTLLKETVEGLTVYVTTKKTPYNTNRYVIK